MAQIDLPDFFFLRSCAVCARLWHYKFLVRLSANEHSGSIFCLVACVVSFVFFNVFLFPFSFSAIILVAYVLLLHAGTIMGEILRFEALAGSGQPRCSLRHCHISAGSPLLQFNGSCIINMCLFVVVAGQRGIALSGWQWVNMRNRCVAGVDVLLSQWSGKQKRWSGQAHDDGKDKVWFGVSMVAEPLDLLVRFSASRRDYQHTLIGCL